MLSLLLMKRTSAMPPRNMAIVLTNKRMKRNKAPHFVSCRSGSAVKRNQTLAFGSPLGSQRKGSSTPAGRAKRDGHKNSFGGKVGHSTAKRQKRKALMDILDRVSL